MIVCGTFFKYYFKSPIDNDHRRWFSRGTGGDVGGGDGDDGGDGDGDGDDGGDDGGEGVGGDCDDEGDDVGIVSNHQIHCSLISYEDIPHPLVFF